MTLGDNKNKEVYDTIKKNLDKFIEYFQIDTYKEFDEFKKNILILILKIFLKKLFL